MKIVKMKLLRDEKETGKIFYITERAYLYLRGKLLDGYSDMYFIGSGMLCNPNDENPCFKEVSIRLINLETYSFWGMFRETRESFVFDVCDIIENNDITKLFIEKYFEHYHNTCDGDFNVFVQKAIKKHNVFAPCDLNEIFVYKQNLLVEWQTYVGNKFKEAFKEKTKNGTRFTNLDIMFILMKLQAGFVTYSRLFPKLWKLNAALFGFPVKHFQITNDEKYYYCGNVRVPVGDDTHVKYFNSLP